MISTQALVGLLVLGFATLLLYCQIRDHRNVIKQLRHEAQALRDGVDAHDRALNELITIIDKGHP